MLQSTGANEWGLIISSVADGTRPAVAMGATVTPGNNVYGAYAQLLAATSDDAYGILINCNSNAVSGSARDALMTIGIDPSGGGSYTDTIVDLLVSCAGAYIGSSPGGVWYYFPLRIKAGSTVAAKATVNNATVGTMSAQCWLYCQPARPELLRTGSYVRTFGSTPATSTGTALTAGTAADGAWTQLGSAIAAGDNLWYWEIGVGFNNGTMATQAYHFDLGIGSAISKKLAILNCPVFDTTAESIAKGVAGAYRQAGAGDLVYARGQVGAGASETGLNAAAYAVGG